jgi:hypothetical protein
MQWHPILAAATTATSSRFGNRFDRVPAMGLRLAVCLGQRHGPKQPAWGGANRASQRYDRSEASLSGCLQR